MSDGKKLNMKKKQKKNSQRSRPKAKRTRNQSRPGGQSKITGNQEISYLTTLRQPETTPGGKVPDLCTFPTGTFQLTYDTTIGPNGTGDAYGFSLFPSMQAPIATFSNALPNGAMAFSAVEWPSKAAIIGVYDQYRPVSAEIYLEYIGSTFKDQGYVILALIPRGGIVPTTIATFMALPYTRTYPLREGARVIWKPQDNADFEFKNVLLGTASLFPTIAILAVGMEPAAGQSISAKIRVVANYEGIPKSDTSTLVNAAPSPIDLGALQRAMNYGSDIYNSFSPFLNNVANKFAPSIANLVGGAATHLLRNTIERNGPGRFMTLGNARHSEL